MLAKRLTESDDAYLDSLIANQVEESKTLDYKRTLPGTSDGDKIEFLADVSSFANTAGGDILYGVDAPPPAGIPTSIPGLPANNIEADKLRLENILGTGLDPRLEQIGLQFVPVGSGQGVLIVRIQEGWNRPHRVIFKNHGHFYGRNSSGKYRLDVDQLRDSFLLSQTIADRMRAFRFDRIMRVKADDIPIPLKSGPKLVVHLLPLSAFSGAQRPDISAALADYVLRPGMSGLLSLKPLRASSFGGWNQHVNLEGRAIYPATKSENPAGRSYTQFFRNGALEAVAALDCRDMSGILERELTALLCDGWVNPLREFIPSHLAALQAIRIEPTIYFALSLINVRGFSLAVDWSGGISAGSFDRDDIILPEAVIDSLPTDVDSLLKTPLAMLWNAVGDEFCPYYANGK